MDVGILLFLVFVVRAFVQLLAAVALVWHVILVLSSCVSFQLNFCAHNSLVSPQNFSGWLLSYDLNTGQLLTEQVCVYLGIPGSSKRIHCNSKSTSGRRGRVWRGFYFWAPGCSLLGIAVSGWQQSELWCQSVRFCYIGMSQFWVHLLACCLCCVCWHRSSDLFITLQAASCSVVRLLFWNCVLNFTTWLCCWSHFRLI